MQLCWTPCVKYGSIPWFGRVSTSSPRLNELSPKIYRFYFCVCSLIRLPISDVLAYSRRMLPLTTATTDMISLYYTPSWPHYWTVLFWISLAYVSDIFSSHLWIILHCVVYPTDDVAHVITCIYVPPHGLQSYTIIMTSYLLYYPVVINAIRYKLLPQRERNKFPELLSAMLTSKEDQGEAPRGVGKSSESS
jgi:hypothetical protein